MSDKPNVFKDKNSTQSVVLSFIGAHFGGVAISVFACLGLASFMSSIVGMICIQLFLFLAYSFPVYNLMWSLGNRDLNRFNFKHIEREQLRGLKIGLFGIIPILVISLVFAASKITGAFDFTSIYRLINGHVWPTLNMINLNTNGIFTWWQVVLFVIVPSVLPVAVSTLGYILGNHDFSPIQKLIYKNKQNKKSADSKTAKKYPYQR